MMQLIRSILLGLVILMPLSAHPQLWETVGAEMGAFGGVTCLFTDTVSNELYIGGQIKWVGDLYCPGIVKYDGTNYAPVGCGIEFNCVDTLSNNGYPTGANSITRYQGDIYAAGDFDMAGGVPVRNIARWDGAQWNAVGNGTNNLIYQLRVIDNLLYAVGGFDSAGVVAANGLAKWDGVEWNSVYNFPNLNSPNLNIVRTVESYNDELFVGGNFDSVAGMGDLVRWNGVEWLGAGGSIYGSFSFVEDMEIYNGQLYIVGAFSKFASPLNPGNNIAAWDGTQWHDVGGGTAHPVWPTSNGQIHDIHVMNGELWVAGAFKYAGGLESQYLARWNGAEWCTLEGGEPFNNRLRALAILNDTIYIGGAMNTYLGQSLKKFAQHNGAPFQDSCGVYTSITEEDLITQPFIYPNPTSELLNIDIGQVSSLEGQFAICNLLGRQVFTQETKKGWKSISLDIGHLDNGMYFLAYFEQGKVLWKKKILVE